MNLSKRKTIQDIKNKTKPLVCLTAYTKPLAQIIDKYVDVILVGDSLGTVLYGLESTKDVTLEMMINHAKAVVKSTKNALVVVDLPFNSYNKSKINAYKNSLKVIRQTGANAVKVEGGKEISELVSYLVNKGIKVMGHVGMLPQSIDSNAKYKIYGRTKFEEKKLKEDVIALEKAGVFSIVIEATVESLASSVSNLVEIPCIGIGASIECKGQILVTEDLIGLTDFKARFVKNFCHISRDIKLAVKKFSLDVENKKFPKKNNTYQD